MEINVNVLLDKLEPNITKDSDLPKSLLGRMGLVLEKESIMIDLYELSGASEITIKLAVLETESQIETVVNTIESLHKNLAYKYEKLNLIIVVCNTIVQKRMSDDISIYLNRFRNKASISSKKKIRLFCEIMFSGLVKNSPSIRFFWRPMRLILKKIIKR